MRSDRTVPGVELTPGVYHWQVARTLGGCLGCPPAYETGPVRSFTLRDEVTLTIGSGPAPYGGYARRFALGAKGAADGLDVVLEHRRGTRWVAVGRGSVRDARASAIATLPRGRQTVRVAFERAGRRSYGAARTITVRDGDGRRQLSRRADGVWTGRTEGAPEASRFRVVRGGREIRDLRVPVLLGCPNPGPIGGTILLRSPGIIRIPRARIAPDGRFAAIRPDRGGVADVSGRLRNGRLLEGRVSLVRGECTISAGWVGQRGG